MVTRYANISDIVNPRITSARSWMNFSGVDPFRPWLKMQQPGFQLWHLAGRKVANFDELPDYLRQYIAERFPSMDDLPPIEI